MLGLSSILQEDSSDSSIPLLQHIKQEEPYDSGYLSPGPQIQSSTMPCGEMTLLSQAQTSPAKRSSLIPQTAIHPLVENLQKPPVYEDVGLSEEWEKDFFANFEENLFSLDLDDQVLDDILKSPKGKVALNEMINSPKGKSLMNSPKGKKIKERMRQGILSPSDSNKPGITPIKQDSQKALKMSKRKLSMGTINQPLKSCISSVSQVPVTKENEEPVSWPSQERLKFARNQFKDILKKAVQKVATEEAAFKARLEEKTKRQKGKSDKYPQLSKALSRPSVSSSTETSQPTRKSERKSQTLTAGMLLSGCQLKDDWYNPDDDDDDEDWRGDLPFTGFKQATKRRKKPVSGQTKRRKAHSSAR